MNAAAIASVATAPGRRGRRRTRGVDHQGLASACARSGTGFVGLDYTEVDPRVLPDLRSSRQALGTDLPVAVNYLVAPSAGRVG